MVKLTADEARLLELARRCPESPAAKTVFAALEIARRLAQQPKN
ncbi:hypothetical protein [Azospirillum sp. B4]|nr:hypothetical protein [Azospirillum sp. B4]